MKVLLIGDFSSFHKYLSDGLKANGCEVTLVSGTDGWKKIKGADFSLYDNSVKCSGALKHFLLYREACKTIDKLDDDYDVVQFINPRIYTPYINWLLIKKLKKKGKVISLVSCGNDLALNQAYRDGKFDYYMMDGEKELLNEYSLRKSRGIAYTTSEKKFLEYIDCIIPTLYEYRIGYGNDCRLTKTIPMPINLESIIYKENVVKDKIVIFHGISRRGAKGSDFIEEAMKKIKEKYPHDVEIIVAEKLPFEEYVRIMDKANIVIDQCRSYGYGINADIAMAQGKVVLSGARKETLESLGVSKCPIFGIIPDENQIYQQLEFIVMNRDKITLWGKESREYVEKVHDCKKVAKEYIKVWSKGLNE